MGGRGLSAGCSICAWIAWQIEFWLHCPVITAGSCCFLQHKITVGQLVNLVLVWLLDVLVVFTVVTCCCGSKYVPYYIILVACWFQKFRKTGQAYNQRKGNRFRF
jgi:hypothetical protein